MTENRATSGVVNRHERDLGVTPYERIEELKHFYVGNVVSHQNIIEAEPPKRKMGEEAKGQWVTEQYSSAAKTLSIYQFVTPLDRGGIEIPELMPQEAYYEAFLQIKSTSMSVIEESVAIKESRVEERTEQLKAVQAKRRRARRMSADSELGEGNEGNEELRQRMVDVENDLEKEVDSAYVKWEKAVKILKDDKQALENWKEECRRLANKQYDADCDALARLKNALTAIKQYLQDLMKKVPEVVEVVHSKKNDDGLDPFEENDMRACMENLLSRYRKDDELGVLTTVIQGMKEQQGSKSLPAYFRIVEDWKQDMKRLGVEHVSIEDLAAFIAISGMQETHRTNFMAQENIYTLAMQHLEDDASDDMSSSGASKRPKKTLFSKVRDYVRKDDDTRLINQKLRSTTKDSNQTTNELKQKMIEAQQAFHIATGAGKEASPKKEQGVCFRFQQTGKCEKGDCRFKHERVATPVVRQCTPFKTTGKCRFGDKCFFKHTTENKANVVQDVPSASGTNPQKSQSKGSNKSLLFDIRETDWDDESEDKAHSNFCVLVQSRDEKYHQKRATSEQVQSVTTQRVSTKLGWDTMASLHVAKSLESLPGARQVKTERQAQGLGGTLEITHQGVNPIFNLEMAYIDGGETPNLMSVGKILQPDESGKSGVAIFTKKGAVRMRTNGAIDRAIQQIMDKAQEQNLIEGYARMKDGVYTEEFGDGETESESTQENACAVNSMYASRVPFATENQVIGMLVSAGVTQKALLEGIQQKSIQGLPEGVTEAQVNKYFREVGKDEDLVRAEIVKLPLRKPLDYNKMVTNTPGEVLYIDNVDPSFSRMTGSNASVASVDGGYRDAVIAVDGATGYVEIEGRRDKKDPHKIVSMFVHRWVSKWRTLKLIKTDKEFVTKASKLFIDTQGGGMRLGMAVPYDHRRGLDMGEGAGRWIQEVAQGHMNRAKHWMVEGIITEIEWRSLWYHALLLAKAANSMKQSLCINGRTRYEEANGRPFNLSEVVILPFATPTVVRKGEGDGDGRGAMGLYLCPSEVVNGGILTLSLDTRRVTTKYSFAARDRFPTVHDIDISHAAGAVYGQLQCDESLEETFPTKQEQWEADEMQTDRLDGTFKDTAEKDETPQELSTSADFEGVSIGENDPPDKEEEAKIPVIDTGQEKSHRYNTRNRKSKIVQAYAVSDRPPKPNKVPTRREAAVDPKWTKASEREQQKLMDEEVFISCPTDANGNPILPENHITIPLIEILEWKWKKDPDTGIERWLECSRIVGNGAKDDRANEKTYAETPDRSLLLYMLSVGATKGEKAMVGDAVRAYLNALSLDRNIVIYAPATMRLLPRVSILNKGLYGTIKGALSFQVWVDEKLMNIGYSKCDVARGVYLKRENDQVARVYRHSDDFRLSSTDDELLAKEVKEIESSIRTNGFKPESRFLGITIERLNYENGESDPAGQLVVIRIEEKINQMQEKFGYLIEKFNPRGRPREAPIPVNALKEDLNDCQKQLLNDKDTKTYMELVGVIGWITTVRMDSRFAYYIEAIRLSKPRVWDMYLAVFTMEFLILSKEAPLILGGQIADPEVLCDASYGILPERRSVKGHLARTGPESGCILASCGSIKNCVKSVWECELNAASDGIDTSIFMDRAGIELQYETVRTRKVKSDSEATLNWVEGCVPTKNSRHVETRLYNARHLSARGEVVMEYVCTEENIADILTKPLPAQRYKKLMQMVLGHMLVKGYAVRGVQQREM